jgi:hypothetical protein
MLSRALSMLLVLGLGAGLSSCAVSGVFPDWTSEDVAGPEPVDYRYIIANHLNEVAGDPKIAGTFEISGIKRVDSLLGASWQTCLKVQKSLLPPRYYAVFIQREHISGSRVSVLIDQCELQSYAPFDWVTEGSTPPAQ